MEVHDPGQQRQEEPAEAAHQEPPKRITFLNGAPRLYDCWKKGISGTSEDGRKIDFRTDYGKTGKTARFSDSELKILSQCLLRQKGLKRFEISICKPQVEMDNTLTLHPRQE